MSDKVSITQSKLDRLANAVSAKSGEQIPLTIDEMTEAVKGINTSGTVRLQDKSVTPTESPQEVTADEGYDGLGAVDVGAISSSYVGTSVPRRTAEDIDVSANTVSFPRGYYETAQSASVRTMTPPSGTDSQPAGQDMGDITQATDGSTFRYLNIGIGYNPSAVHYTLPPITQMELPTYTETVSTGTQQAQLEASSIQDTYLNIPTGYNNAEKYYVIKKASSSAPNLQAKSVSYSPSETAQSDTVTPDNGYDGLSSVAVSVGAVPIGYVGSGIPRRSSSDLSESNGTVTALAGYYSTQATKEVTLTPFAIRPDAELIQSYTHDKYAVADLGLTIPSYSTTAQTIKASSNLSPTITVDLNNYRYFIAERFLTIPEYSVTSKAKGRVEYQWCSYFYEVAHAVANEFATIIDPTKKITSVQNLWATNSLFRMLYWSSSSAIALYASNSYGVYQTPTSPSISGSTLTVKAPAFATRGSTTYFTSTYMNALTDIRYQYAIDVYRVPVDSLNTIGWEQDQTLQHFIECINSSNHDLT